MTRLDRMRALAELGPYAARRDRAREAHRCARRRRDRPRWAERLARASRRPLRRDANAEPRGDRARRSARRARFRPTAIPSPRSSCATARSQPMIRRDRASCPTSSSALAAPSGGDKLSTRIVERARKLADRELQARDRGSRSLGRVRRGSDRAHGRAARRRRARRPMASWAAVAAYLARPRHAHRDLARAAAAACRQIVERMAAAQAAVVIDATAGLCDAAIARRGRRSSSRARRASPTVGAASMPRSPRSIAASRCARSSATSRRRSTRSRDRSARRGVTPRSVGHSRQPVARNTRVARVFAAWGRQSARREGLGQRRPQHRSVHRSDELPHAFLLVTAVWVNMSSLENEAVGRKAGGVDEPEKPPRSGS